MVISFRFDFPKCSNKYACKYDSAKISKLYLIKMFKADRGIHRKVKK